MISPYPEGDQERDRWIISRRGPRNTLDLHKPYAFFVEDERSESGEIVPVATLFLTNRECPFRCLVCDLWKNTWTGSVPSGAIPRQIDYALDRLPIAREIKLYNNGNFFDHRAIPLEDYPSIAARLQDFDRVIVESHPSFANDSCLYFRDLLIRQEDVRLEVAMGLETVHEEVLERLNKRMTLRQFSQAASVLRKNEIALRSFVLVQPPFVREKDASYWAEKAIDFSFDLDAKAVCLIPTRSGNGALEALEQSGDFSQPDVKTLEAALDYGIGLRKGRVFADLWDFEKFGTCASCSSLRKARMQEMNLQQTVLPALQCRHCQGKNAAFI